MPQEVQVRGGTPLLLCSGSWWIIVERDPDVFDLDRYEATVDHALGPWDKDELDWAFEFDGMLESLVGDGCVECRAVDETDISPDTVKMSRTALWTRKGAWDGHWVEVYNPYLYVPFPGVAKCAVRTASEAVTARPRGARSSAWRASPHARP